MWDSVQDLAAPIRVLLTALTHRDFYTAEHSNRTTALAGELGKRCNLSAQQLDLLYAAAAVHDIGKIGIPDSVLLKPGRLSSDEWTIMKGHAAIGSRMLAAIPAFEEGQVIDAVHHHHEAFDGNGYPDGLGGEAIPFMSRIISIADSYDAMATARPYHKPRSHDEIMAILQGECAGRYDPWMLERFTQLIEGSSYHADRFSGDRQSTF